MDAATTNKVLKKFTPNNVFSKMRLKNLRRKRTESTASAVSGSSLRVQFNSRATVAQTIEYYDSNDLTPEEEKSLRWYDKEELHAMFLKDLEEHLHDQVHHSSIKTACAVTDGRGLELHFAHNQQRKDQADRYVKAIVDKSYAIRQTASSYSPMKARRKAYQDVWAEDLAHYACQYTWMTRDWALADAEEDEAQARAIYNENDQHMQLMQEEVESTGNESTNCDNHIAGNKGSKCNNDKETLQIPAHLSPVSKGCRDSRPTSFPAKSA